jgi:hypothetical protein
MLAICSTILSQTRATRNATVLIVVYYNEAVSAETGSPDPSPRLSEGPLGPRRRFSPGAGSVDRASFKKELLRQGSKNAREISEGIMSHEFDGLDATREGRH